MADGVEEELEPLFDYSRVQPPDFLALADDDEPDPSPCSPSLKRRKCSSAAANGENPVALVEDDAVEEDEEDWLPPPPQQTTDTSLHLAQDETIRELRMKKEELASFARSTDDVMRAVIESAKKDLKSSDDPEPEERESSVKPNVDQPKILISIQGKEGLKQFRMCKDDKLERLFKMYATWAKVDLESLVFCFDGEKVNAGATPAVMELEDDDIIEVHVKTHH